MTVSPSAVGVCRDVFPALGKFLEDLVLRWHGRHSAEVNENINLGYSHDQGYS